MNPSEKTLWAKAQRRAAGLSPDISSAIMRAFKVIIESLTGAELIRAIQSGYAEKILDDAVLQRAFMPLRERIRQGVNTSVVQFAKDLPKSKSINFAFDTLNPDVLVAVKKLETTVITSLSDDIREVVRQRVAEGLTKGESPAAVARDLRSVIGLSPKQVEQSANLRAQLVEKEVEAGRIERMVATYERRRIAQNAETISRTTALDAMKLGQKLSMDHAVAIGVYDSDQLTKTWVGVLDDRERDSHVEMEGETVPYDEPYSNGQMVPGDDEYNCRCISRYSTQ